jgi:hypothetical protein
VKSTNKGKRGNYRRKIYAIYLNVVAVLFKVNYNYKINEDQVGD